jgi:hypothetical protein
MSKVPFLRVRLNPVAVGKTPSFHSCLLLQECVLLQYSYGKDTLTSQLSASAGVRTIAIFLWERHSHFTAVCFCRTVYYCKIHMGKTLSFHSCLLLQECVQLQDTYGKDTLTSELSASAGVCTIAGHVYHLLVFWSLVL